MKIIGDTKYDVKLTLLVVIILCTPSVHVHCTADVQGRWHISRTTELTKSYLFIRLFTLSVGLKYEVVSRSAECCTQFSRERDQQSAYFPTDDIFLNFGSNSRLAVYSKPDSV